MSKYDGGYVLTIHCWYWPECEDAITVSAPSATQARELLPSRVQQAGWRKRRGDAYQCPACVLAEMEAYRDGPGRWIG